MAELLTIGFGVLCLVQAMAGTGRRLMTVLCCFEA
jgi:hypothetical protein